MAEFKCEVIFECDFCFKDQSAVLGAENEKQF